MVSVLDPRLPSTYRAQVNSSTHMFRNTTLYKQVIPILRICVTYYYAHIWMPYYIINARLNIYLHHNYNILLIVNKTSSETYVVNNNMYKRSTPQKNMIPKIPFCKNIMTYRRYSYNIAAYQKFIHKNVVLSHFCNMM